MRLRSSVGSGRLAAAVVVLATTVLVVRLLHPPSVVVVADGVHELGTYYTRRDAAVLVVSAAALGAGVTRLLTEGTGSPERPGADAVDASPEGTPRSDASPTAGSNGSDGADDLLAARREEWSETADRLANSERVVYEAVLDADGVLEQRAVVERTDLSKATVSRALDGLESKDLVERRRRGTGNVVFLR